jgi:Ankyrin repeats (many copies)
MIYNQEQYTYKQIKTVIETCDVNERFTTSPFNEWTALMFAVQADRYDLVLLLIQKGADVNKPCCNFWFPLTRACFYNFEQVFRVLLTNGASEDAKQQVFLYACRRPCAIKYLYIMYREGGFDWEGTQIPKIPYRKTRENLTHLVHTRRNLLQCLHAQKHRTGVLAAMREEGLLRTLLPYLL